MANCKFAYLLMGVMALTSCRALRTQGDSGLRDEGPNPAEYDEFFSEFALPNRTAVPQDQNLPKCPERCLESYFKLYSNECAVEAKTHCGSPLKFANNTELPLIQKFPPINEFTDNLHMQKQRVKILKHIRMYFTVVPPTEEKAKAMEACAFKSERSNDARSSRCLVNETRPPICQSNQVQIDFDVAEPQFENALTLFLIMADQKFYMGQNFNHQVLSKAFNLLPTSSSLEPLLSPFFVKQVYRESRVIANDAMQAEESSEQTLAQFGAKAFLKEGDLYFSVLESEVSQRGSANIVPYNINLSYAQDSLKEAEPHRNQPPVVFARFNELSQFATGKKQVLRNPRAAMAWLRERVGAENTLRIGCVAYDAGAQ